MIPATPVLVDAPSFERTVLRLLRPRGGARPWPKKQLDRWVLLHCAARRLADGERLSERDANARLQDWLLGPADRLDVDFVTLRRALIDEGFWDRESGGSDYRRALRHERRVRFASDLPDEVDLLAARDTGTAAGGLADAHGASGPPHA